MAKSSSSRTGIVALRFGDMIAVDQLTFELGQLVLLVTSVVVDATGVSKFRGATAIIIGNDAEYYARCRAADATATKT